LWVRLYHDAAGTPRAARRGGLPHRHRRLAGGRLRGGHHQHGRPHLRAAEREASRGTHPSVRQTLCRAGGRSMSAIQWAYKVELDLNNEQTTACKKHAGAARWAYNWGLQRKQEEYRETGKSPSAMELHRDLNALKPTDVPWMYAVSKC